MLVWSSLEKFVPHCMRYVAVFDEERAAAKISVFMWVVVSEMVYFHRSRVEMRSL